MSAVLKEILDERNPWSLGGKAIVPAFRRFLYYKLYGEVRNKKVSVILGVRQTGKTTLLLQLANDLFGSYNVYYVPVDAVIEHTKQHAIREALSVVEKYYLGEKLHLVKKPTMIILDEVHFDPEWGLQVKVLHDRIVQWGAPVKVMVTGSSAISIKTAIAEYLTGRVTIDFINPMSLAEFVTMEEGLEDPILEGMEKSTRILTSRDPYSLAEEILAIISPLRPRLERALNEMLIYGGMPEILAKNLRGIDAQRILESYVYITLFKDVLRVLESLGERIKLAGKLERLIKAILYKSPRIVSVNSIATDLGASQETIEQYVDLILSTHLIQRANNYSKSPIVEARKRKHKYYACDTGIRNAITWGIMPRKISSEEEGMLLENLALIHAKRMLKRISWKKEPKFIKVGNYEGDIIIEYPDNTVLVEVKRKRRTRRRLRTYGIDRAIQITMYEEERTIPAIVFLLGDPLYEILRANGKQ